MDGSEFDLANLNVFPDSPYDIPGGDADNMDCSTEKYYNNNYTCTHTHTRNPLGPDLSHTYTCRHVHIQTIPTADDTTAPSSPAGGVKKTPCGNREAVRKYREKKKAQAASLEDENRQLREENTALQRRVQALAAIETVDMRFKSLLVDLRGRIDVEIGLFPYHMQQVRPPGVELATSSAAAAAGVGQVNSVSMASVCGGAQVFSSCGLPCDDQTYCTRPPLMQGRDGTGQTDSIGCVRTDSPPPASQL